MSSKFLRVRSVLLMVCITILAVWIIHNVSSNQDEQDGDSGMCPPFSLIYKQDGIKDRIKGFYMEETLYFFIPGYLQLENITLAMDKAETLYIGDEELKGGDALDKVELNREYTISVCEESKSRYEGVAVFMQGSQIPVIRLTTASGSMEYIHADKEHYEGGFMEVADEEGRVQIVAGMKSLSARGNTAWDARKKSYTIKLDDAQDILGEGAEKIWVLNANYYDGAYIRNQIGFEMAKIGGISFSPEARFVDLYINDEYMGLYQIMEKVKAGKNRVDIGNNYLLEIDYIERAVLEDDYILLPNGQPIVIHAPKKDCDVEGVQKFFDDFTTAVETGDMAAVMGAIDMDSFAKMFVMEEILQDMDFGYSSHYMYLDLDEGILYDGPVWDLDNTMGRGIVMEAVPLFVTDYDLQYNNLSRLYASLYAQPEFRKQVLKEYKEHFRPVLCMLLDGGIEDEMAAIAASISMDQKRFVGGRSTFMTDNSLKEHREYLIKYMQDKLRIMDKWLEEESKMADTAREVVLPALEAREPPGGMGTETAEEERGGIIYFFMYYRFWFTLLVMFSSYMILWYRCKRAGK